MLRWTIPLVLVALCGTVLAPEGRYAGSRPHSVAAIRDRDGVAVTRLQARTRRVDAIEDVVRVAVPPPKTDVVVVAVIRGRRFRHGSDPTTYGYLQLQSEGWRGRNAGRTYGLAVERLEGFDVHELHFNGIGLGPNEARAAVMGRSAPRSPPTSAGAARSAGAVARASA